MVARPKKKEEKKELTPQEEVKADLSNQVKNYLNLFRAAAFGRVKVVEKLLDDGAAADAFEPESGNTALILSSKSGGVKVVQLLIGRGRANVNLQGYAGLTPLHHACKNDHTEVARVLLEDAKANTEVEDDAGNTATSYAARQGNLKCLELLASRGANLDHPNRRLCTPFMAAVLNCRGAILDVMLKKKINVNATDSAGNTALHYAAKCGYTSLIRQLINAGVKPDTRNLDGKKAEDVSLNDSVTRAFRSDGSVTDQDDELLLSPRSLPAASAAAASSMPATPPTVMTTISSGDKKKHGPSTMAPAPPSIPSVTSSTVSPAASAPSTPIPPSGAVAAPFAATTTANTDTTTTPPAAAAAPTPVDGDEKRA